MRHLILNVGHFQTHFFLLLYPTVVLTLERQGDGAYGDLLLPATASWVAFAALTLPAAWAGDRFPKGRLITLMFFGLALGSLVAALAESTLMLTLGLALIGAAAAIYHPVGIALLAEEAEQTGRAIGVNGVWGNLGVAAAPLGAALLAEGLGWRWAFAVPAALALATGVWQATRSRRPRRLPRPPERPRAPAARGALLRVVIFFLAGGLFGGLIFNALTVALPKLVEDELVGGGSLGAGAIASAIFALAAFSQLVSGRLLDRLPLRNLAATITLLQGIALACMALTGGVAALLAMLAAVALVFAEIPVGDTLVKRVTPPALRARAYGVVYLISFAAAAATVPLIAWIYDDGGSLTPLIWVLAASACVVSLAAWSLPRGITDPQGPEMPQRHQEQRTAGRSLAGGNPAE